MRIDYRKLKSDIIWIYLHLHFTFDYTYLTNLEFKIFPTGVVSPLGIGAQQSWNNLLRGTFSHLC